jgi:hypothetical protein
MGLGWEAGRCNSGRKRLSRLMLAPLIDRIHRSTGCHRAADEQNVILSYSARLQIGN